MKKIQSSDTADQYWVKEHNLSFLLEKVWNSRGPVSRPELRSQCGMNKMTVSNLLQQLQEWGFVRATGSYQPSYSGRPGTLYEINPDAGLIVGMEIGIASIDVALSNFTGQLLWRQTEPVTNPRENVFHHAEDLLTRALQAARAYPQRRLGIGLAVAALVAKDGTIALDPGSLEPVKIHLVDEWQSRYQMPVFVTNDGNASAVGEQILGEPGFEDDFIFINAGEGLGAGIVAHGELYEGAGGFAGEFGHMTIDYNGGPCKCGGCGCWENYVSLSRAVQNWADHPGFNAARYPLRLSDSAREDFFVLVKAAGENDPAALDTFNQLGCYFGIGLSSLINIFNPRYIFLGGTLCLGSRYFFPAMQAEIQKRSFKAASANLQKVSAVDHPLDSTLLGAVSLVIRDILAGPVRWQPQERPAPEMQPWEPV
jgi:predicted NBD/HSP70 family sugar kinase